METAWPNLPAAITSFGAAVLGDAVYVYGGHHGSSHHYSNEGQSGDLLRMSLQSPGNWEVVSNGPRLQGLAIVEHRGGLICVGGFEARNSKDQPQSLWSIADCARFEPATGEWAAFPSLPQGRSSFDAAILGDALYVVGGWLLEGENPPVWQGAALALDLSAPAPQWRELPSPGFERRALSVGIFDRRLFVLGGMQSDGNVTCRTAIYDPEARQWSEGPELPGEGMDGFGAACCPAEGRLYVSTSSGRLLRLSEDGKAWETVGGLRAGRFFHRMLAIGGSRLLLLGGASMQRGKFATLEEVSIV